MANFGPVESSRDGVIVGDRGRTHLLLTPDGVSQRLGRSAVHAFAWEDVQRLKLDVPTTQSRWRGAVGRALSPLRLLSSGLWDVDPPTASVRIEAAGEDYPLDLDRHHFGGYWRPAVEATQRMIDRLITNPETRERLADPDRVLQTLMRDASS